MSVDDVKIVGVSFSWEKWQGVYIPLFNDGKPGRDASATYWPNPRVWDSVIAFLRETLSSDIPKIAHNGKFDIQWLMRLLDVEVNNFVFDTMLAHSLIDEERVECTHKLKDMAARYINPAYRDFEAQKDQALDHYDPTYRRYSFIPLDILYPYGCADADMTLQLADIMADRLAEEGLDSVMDDIMMPLSWVATMSELHGMPVNPGRLEELDVSLREKMGRLIPEMQAIVGPDVSINFNSTDQLGKLLYETYGFPERRTDRGEYNVDAEALKSLLGKHPLIQPLMDYRRALKIHGTYVLKPLGMRDRVTGAVYHTILVGQTKTGRCACVDGDTVLDTDRGRFRIKDISLAKPTSIITHEGRWQPIERVFTKGVAPMYRVSLTTGEQIVCTIDHRFNTPSGWARLGDLEVGCEVVRYQRRTLCPSVHHGKIDDTGGSSEVRDIPRTVLSTEGAAAEVQGSAQGSFTRSLRTEQARQRLWQENQARCSSGQGSSCSSFDEGTPNRCYSQGVELQRVLGHSEHRASQDQSLAETNGTHPDKGVQPRAARAYSPVVPRTCGSREGLSLQPGWVCGEARTSVLGACRGCLEGIRYRSSHLEAEGRQAEILGDEQGYYLPSLESSRCRHSIRQGDTSRELQIRLSCRESNSDRGGWSDPRDGIAEEEGCGEDRTCEVRRVYLASILGQVCLERNRPCDNGDSGGFGVGVIASIEPIGVRLVWDLTVSHDHSYVAQGFVSHNSENPNTQNLPRPTNGGLEAKSVYAAPPGKKIVLIDLAQIELVVTADISQEPVWVSAFRNNEDLHSKTAVSVFKLPCTWQEVKEKYDDKRTAAKCFHPDTEVLTKTGWKRIVDLSPGEEVIQAKPRSGWGVDLEWAVPTEVFTKKDPTQMLLHFYNEGMDLRVTLDHRMLAFDDRGNPKTVLAKDFYGDDRGWMNAGVLDNGSVVTVSDVLLKLAVATQADGHITPSGSIRFGFTKARKVERLLALLEQSGISYSTSTLDRVTSVSIYKKNAGPILSLLEGKKFPWSWLNLSHAQRLVVLDEVQHWDGHSRGNWRMTRYTNCDQQSLDVLQAIASITGRKTRLRPDSDPSVNHRRVYNLTIRDKASTRGGNLTRRELPYTGEVACLSVPSSWVLVRDGGVPCIVGQSVNFGVLYGQTEHGLADGLNIPLEEAEKLIESYFNGLTKLKEWIDNTHASAMRDGYVTNPFGRRRHLKELLDWVPNQQTKPSGAPRCWAWKEDAPQVKTIFPDIELPRSLPVIQNNGQLRSAIATHGTVEQKKKCLDCYHKVSCTIESYRRNRQARTSKLLREATNFIIQSTATADISAKWWAGIALEARRQGIDISWRPGSKGGCPINLVHDEVVYVVDDEYVPAYLKIADHVLKGVYPGCSLPLRYDAEVVQVWSDKHLKDKRLHWDGPKMETYLREQGITPHEVYL